MPLADAAASVAHRTTAAAALVVLALSGCRGPQPCVEVASSEILGTPQRSYDEFTQVTTVTSAFVLTPDQEWTLADQREDGLIHWSVEMWTHGSSASPYLDLTLRVRCLAPAEDESERGESCQNCDTVCSEQRGGIELLADGRPIAVPPARYKRMPMPSPTPESPSTWASTLMLSATPDVLWPLAEARQIKLRACGSIVATLRPLEVGNLQEMLRHHRAIAPPPPPR
jgi:hypothetical protein